MVIEETVAVVANGTVYRVDSVLALGCNCARTNSVSTTMILYIMPFHAPITAKSLSNDVVPAGPVGP